MLRIFIGYDPRQAVAYQVLHHSILMRSSRPVAVCPLVLASLPISRSGLTPFTYSRFLVPWLSGYQGWALFLDLDMLVLEDIAKLFALADDRYAVMVTKNPIKMERSSLILFNCGHAANRILEPHYVDNPEICRSPHIFDWLSDELVGDLPAEWNHTVGYDRPRSDAKLVHFTQGIPLHPELQGCEYSEVWLQAARHANATHPWIALLGRSVHAVQLSDGRVVPRLRASTPGNGG
jgi:hypothetical protein